MQQCYWMNTTNKHIEEDELGHDILLSYIYGELPPGLSRQVKQQITRNPDLRITVEGMELIRGDYALHSKAEHLDWLNEKQMAFAQQVKLSSSRPEKPTSMRRWMYYGVAAAVVGLLIWIFGYMITPHPNPSTLVVNALAESTAFPLFSTKSGPETADYSKQFWKRIQPIIKRTICGSTRFVAEISRPSDPYRCRSTSCSIYLRPLPATVASLAASDYHIARSR